MIKKTREMDYAAAFKLPTAAITTAQRLGVLSKPLPPLEKIEMEDRHFLEAFSRCWENTGFIVAGLAELSPAKRDALMTPKKRRFPGWKGEADHQYWLYYHADFTGNSGFEDARDVTVRLKKDLFLPPEQCGELDAIRRAAKNRARLAAEKYQKEEDVW